jgi:hypothetical protein
MGVLDRELEEGSTPTSSDGLYMPLLPIRLSSSRDRYQATVLWYTAVARARRRSLSASRFFVASR